MTKNNVRFVIEAPRYEALTLVSITPIIIEIMKDAHKISGLSGKEKKAYVIKTITSLIESISDEKNPDESKDAVALEKLLIFTVPTLIDMLIEVDNGDLSINKTANTLCSKLLCCFCWWK